jgi:hypothetical protein
MKIIAAMTIFFLPATFTAVSRKEARCRSLPPDTTSPDILQHHLLRLQQQSWWADILFLVVAVFSSHCRAHAAGYGNYVAIMEKERKGSRCIPENGIKATQKQVKAL